MTNKKKEPEPKEELVPFTVRFPVSSLERLGSLEAQTHVTAREWIRALLESIQLPIAVVSLEEAERCGLLAKSKNRKGQS